MRNFFSPVRRPHVLLASAVIALSAVSGCSTMSRRDQNTAVGASVGAIGGALLTAGSPLATVGGAVVGGVIGHQMHSRP